MAVFSDDWEAGAGAWSTTGSTGTWTVDTTVVHGGTHSYKIVNGTGTQSSVAVHNLGVDVTNCRVDFWCRLTTDVGFQEIMEVRDSGSTNHAWTLTHAGGGILALFGFRVAGGSSVEVDTGATFSMGVWHHVVVDFCAKVQASGGGFSITLDGTKFSSAAGDYSGASKPHIVQLWCDVASQTQYYDDLVVTDLDAAGGTNATQTLSATSTTGASLIRAPGKVLSAASTTAATLKRAPARALSATLSSVASIVKSPAHALSASLTSTATLLKTPGKALSAALTSTASIVKQAGKVVAATSTTVASIAQRAVTHSLSATSTTGASLLKTPGKVLSAAQSTLATVTGSRLAFQTLSAVSTTTATLSKLVGKVASTSTTTTSTLSKAVSHTLSATSTLGASIAKGVSKTFSIISSLAASVVGLQVTVQPNVIGGTEPLGSLDIEPGIGSLDIDGSIGRLDVDPGP